MRIRYLFPVILTSLILYATYLTFGPAPGRVEQPIRIAINPWPGYEPLYLAHQKGFFQEEGVEVELVELGSLADIRRVFERGLVDMMTSTLSEVVEAQPNTDRDIKIMLVPDFSNGTDVIIAQQEYETLEELHGRRIGVEVGALGKFFLSRALQTRGMTLEDVTIVPVEQLQAKRLMATGKLDAVVSYPPFCMEVRNAVPVNTVFTSAEIPGEIVDVVAGDAELMKTRSKDLGAIVRAWDKALAFTAAHPEEAHALMARREGITPEEFTTALKGIQLLTSQEQMRYLGDGTVARAIDHVSALLFKVGDIENTRPGELYLHLDAIESANEQPDASR